MSTNINIKKKLAILEEGASVTTDATSIDFVGSGVNASTIDGDVTVTIPGNSGNTTYYLNESVTQAPYKEFSSIVTGAVEQVVPLTVAGGTTSVIAEYQTPSGIPGTTQIPGGLWQFFLHFNAGAAGQNWRIRPTVYKRDLGGTETLLFTPDPEIVIGMSTTTTMYVCDGVFPAATILTTDRIVVRISMQNTTGVSQTVNFRTEGSQHYSVALTTLNQVIPTGAVTSVTGTAPIVSSGGLTPAISIPQSSATVDGYLSSSNWSVFDAKQAALLGTGIVKSTAGTISYLTDNSTNWDTAYTNIITSLTTTGSGAATLISNILNIPTPSSVNIYNANGILTASRTVDLNGNNLTFNDLVGTGSFTALIDDTGGSYGQLTVNVGQVLLETVSSLSGTGKYISVTPTSINIAGYYNLPTSSSPTLNQIPYASSTSQLDFTSVKTINGNSILGSGNLVIGGAGIVGIANSSGVYTYYATLTLAMTAATSGQTVELFSDITETGSVAITLKSGVNINGNGHTYTLSVNDGTNAFTFALSGTVELYNLKVVRTGRTVGTGTGNVLSFQDGNAKIKCFNASFLNDFGYCCVGSGIIYNAHGLGYLDGMYDGSGNVRVYDSYFESTGTGTAINTPVGFLYNSTGKAVSGNGISCNGEVYECTGISSSGIGIFAQRITNCTGLSTSGIALHGEGRSCVGISTSGIGGVGTFYNSTLISSSNYGAASATLYNSYAQSSSSVATNSSSIYNSTVRCLWNNIGGHCTSTNVIGYREILSSFLEVTNASAYCITGYAGSTWKYAANTYKGSTTAVNSTNIIQGITNTSDNQGNILI
jgi:hypothetical protein